MCLFFQLYKLIKKEKFDIVHTHSSKTGFLGRVAAKLAGAKKNSAYCSRIRISLNAK
ncbi:glycosyltransferase [Escherichia coli]|nr:glycosyltransferase [Escherichia coli]